MRVIVLKCLTMIKRDGGIQMDYIGRQCQYAIDTWGGCSGWGRECKIGKQGCFGLAMTSDTYH